jgi:PhnB protein
MTRPIPEGLRSVTPSFSVEGAADAIAFYIKAFGAKEIQRAADPSGQKIWHAQIQIGDSAVFLNDTFPDMGPAQPASLWIYSDNVDAAWKRATEAGGVTIRMPLADMFWGDRTGTLVDRWGIQWTLAQHMKDLTPEQMKKAQDEFVAQMSKQKK